jgi:hypothetical protein
VFKLHDELFYRVVDGGTLTIKGMIEGFGNKVFIRLAGGLTIMLATKSFTSTNVKGKILFAFCEGEALRYFTLLNKRQVELKQETIQKTNNFSVVLR